MVNMMVPPRSEDRFFYMYLHVIYDMGVGIPFTVFEYEVLKTVKVAPSRYNQIFGPLLGGLRSFV